MATRLPDPGLHVLHIEDRQLAKAKVEERLARIKAACAELALPVEVTVAPARSSVAATLLGLVPEDPTHFLVCGTRVRQRGRGFLADTVSEQLLRVGRCQVLSVRVVQPGILGGPRNFLVPVSGRPEGIRVGLPFLRLLVSEASEVEVLLVHRLSHRRFRQMSHPEASRLVEHGQHYVSKVRRSLSTELDLPLGRVDGTAVLSDDIPKEIAIHAGKHKSQLIYMGASVSSLRKRSVYGNPIEQVLRNAPCDVAIYGDPS
jgi:nucleotide-binding universal stress UspA family protein